MATSNRYTFTQRVLHWVVVLMVLGLLAVGLTFWTLGYEGVVGLFGEALTNELYKYHKTFGILVLMLMVLRLALRFAAPPPPYEQPLSTPERLLGGGTHLAFYVLLIGMPIGGWVATAAGGFPVQFFDWELPGLIGKDEGLSEALFQFHGLGGLIILGLLVLHVGAALKHWRQRDGVMRRISLP